jgi:SAM-dependent methyltransferase
MSWIILLLFISLISVAVASFSLIVWVPTRKRDLPRLLALASLQQDESFIDLGCGTGTVSHFIASKTKAAVTGIELALPFYFWCKLRQAASRLKNLHYLWGSLFALDLGTFDVIYVFGIPDKLKDKLKPKLERELKPGARVISYAFAIEGWTPSRISKPDPGNVSIYVYVR